MRSENQKFLSYWKKQNEDSEQRRKAIIYYTHLVDQEKMNYYYEDKPKTKIRKRKSGKEKIVGTPVFEKSYKIENKPKTL